MLLKQNPSAMTYLLLVRSARGLQMKALRHVQTVISHSGSWAFNGD